MSLFLSEPLFLAGGKDRVCQKYGFCEPEFYCRKAPFFPDYCLCASTVQKSIPKGRVILGSRSGGEESRRPKSNTALAYLSSIIQASAPGNLDAELQASYKQPFDKLPLSMLLNVQTYQAEGVETGGLHKLSELCGTQAKAWLTKSRALSCVKRESKSQADQHERTHAMLEPLKLCLGRKSFSATLMKQAFRFLCSLSILRKTPTNHPFTGRRAVRTIPLEV